VATYTVLITEDTSSENISAALLDSLRMTCGEQLLTPLTLILIRISGMQRSWKPPDFTRRNIRSSARFDSVSNPNRRDPESSHIEGRVRRHPSPFQTLRGSLLHSSRR
jgi:hypothetical protein